MNYIISSIVLLSVIIIIIYILSIDNNIDKLKNKFKEIFSVVKSKEINYLNEKDNKNLLLYIKQHFKYNNIDIDNITLPNKIFYNKTERGYEMNNINIICYKYLDNNFKEISKKINILFVPFKKENYISDQSLLGLHGNYMIENINLNEPININVNQKNVTFNTNDSFISQQNKDTFDNQEDNQENNQENNQETYTDVLDMIPDIIHLTEDDSIITTTDTEELISHNFK
jgi:hypothetical protein